mmetsp:Transcript_45060/g.119197  ORF Transcript_45060/g.119197 Transcript_45060/m.119197 type:complete len:252 (-) Transcript_45060:161-916(-)
MPTEPRIAPGLLSAVLPFWSTTCALPSMMVNIQSPTSPSRKISSPFWKTCTVQASASTSLSCGVRELNVWSDSRKSFTRLRCWLFKFFKHSRKRFSPSAHKTPDCVQAIVAVRRTLYNNASSPKVCFCLSVLRVRSSILTEYIPCKITKNRSPLSPCLKIVSPFFATFRSMWSIITWRSSSSKEPKRKCFWKTLLRNFLSSSLGLPSSLRLSACDTAVEVVWSLPLETDCRVLCRRGMRLVCFVERLHPCP